MSQPRGPGGKFSCEPSYPRLRTSSCGCAGGGSKPCPVGQRMRKVRDAARKRFRGRPSDPAVIQELESELYGHAVEREALAEALGWARVQLRNSGSGRRGRIARGRARTLRNAEGDDSEDAYREAVDEWRRLLAHDRHVRALARATAAELRKARGLRPLKPRAPRRRAAHA